MSYWAPAASFVRQSKGMAIHHMSGSAAPPPATEKSPQTKKGRAPGDDSSPVGSEQSTTKKARKEKKPSGGEGKAKDKKKKKKKSAGGEEGARKFVTIQRNIFVERNKFTVPADEVQVCECKRERIETEGACGAKCINRLTFYECLPSHCPLGALCTNQRFQRREYAPLKRFEAGQKGHGVRCERDLRKGEFIMEYCGEVISVRTCMERLKRSRELGEHNFYILTLNAQECVDAAHKGNLARFINHSCEPNCETQKWNVAGELCVGLFAQRDIPAGTELTFDYQFERVGGDKQKCYCGAATCRGYLGAKKPVDEQTKQERKAKEWQAERQGRSREVPFDQLLAIVSADEPPERPPKGLFLHRNARSGYRRWVREVQARMPAKERTGRSEERDVPLERHLRQMLAQLAKEGLDMSLLK